MKNALKFIRLKRPDKYLLIRTAFLMVTIRLGLSIFPFKILLRLLRSWRERRSFQTTLDPKKSERALWAITVMSDYLPGATCLTQGLAALTILGQFGQPADLRIGIAKDKGGALRAHAWLETEGKIVMGNMLDLQRYAMLSPIDGSRIHERHIRNL